ncbi:MAG: hypothetical protein D6812_04595 [Deltaproteobacteria bacterium]|nr:MAG: hypothetical protein D6812_04595 [Deltaproteobacteria bacterium]
MVLHGNGTVAVYPRDYNTLGISPNTPVSQVRPTPRYTFSIGTPHHSAYDPEDKILWTNQGTGIANGYDADPDSETFGQRIKRIQFPINYIEGIAFRFDVCSQQKRLYFYNGPGSSTQGQIWIYNVSTTSSEGDGAFIERTPYESGDLPPFHSECLSWDGAHFWMCGYTDGKVYRMTELVDSDCDGSTDGADNCPNVPNPEQGDRDLDGVGDLCDCQPDNDAEPGDDGVCQPTCVGGVSAVTTETEHYRITGLLLGLLPIVSLLLWRRRRA